ncbi:MAG TPA: rod shape-determining protein RodA [Henriciella marina]|uniref:rod shape-determining protein RodA n=1 Tax=Henriciella sp. TaxID=1968823 RepID=UPI00180B8AE6|nr:rod shape-determining protein RodA [Henriciella sp.]HIG20969.1 rod shape-determining protein RodA [Henriciella sp.]HIK63479.1 rod shape-determining protein RodA [Henriciella marina]
MARAARASAIRFEDRTFAGTLGELPWGLVLMLITVACIGTAALYSSTFTNPEEAGLPARHAVRFAISLGILFVIALVPIGIWLRAAWPAYFVTLAMLIGVELFGLTRGGATRWLQLGPIGVQPSEFMKLALTLALARYYHNNLTFQSGRFFIHLPALFIIIVPAALIFKQPDFGTTLALIASGAVLIFLAGLYYRIIAAVAIAGIASAWPIYMFVLQDYQRERVNTFLAQLTGQSVNALDDGYQIEQAKIAIGSGGWQGRGFMEGTQAQLDYIPEQHTDFILTVIAEEFGFLGATGLLLLWAAILAWGLVIAGRSNSLFGRFAAVGCVATVAFFILFNVAMVLGLVPVVGVPLPLVSYGGTVMFTTMACFGILLSVHLGRDERLSTQGMI